MIKQFSAGDIITRPFKTFKNWNVQSTDVSGSDQFGHSTYIENCGEVNRGQALTTPFYQSGSLKYNPVSEPMTPNGKYERIVYSVTDAMFYRNPTNPMETFGLESVERDPETGRKEERKIHDKIVSLKLAENFWGEKIVPNSVQIVDNSNPHATYNIYDDGMTNLYISGSNFGEQIVLSAVNPLPPLPYWNTASAQFYAIVGGVTQSVSLAVAKNYMNMGMTVFYTEDTASTWLYDYSASRDYYQPENERFGQSVSAWYKYVVVGSPMDSDSLADIRNGYAAIFKYDDAQNKHRLIKKVCSDDQEALALEFPGSSSVDLLQLENNNFLSLESGCFDVGFGYSVSIKDNFFAVGSPTGSKEAVFVYDRFKGGSDNWGIINILSGSVGTRFGHAVSLDNDILAVGIPGANSNEGEVDIYRLKRYMDDTVPCRSIPTASGAPAFVSGNFSWEYETTLSSSVAQAGDNFGWVLEVDNDRLIVGTHNTGSNGYATLFVCNYTSASLTDCPTASWVESKIYTADETLGDLDPTDPNYSVETTLTYDGFGWSVAINGDNLAIGSYYDKGFLPYAGAPLSLLKILGAVYFYAYTNDDCNIVSYHLTQKTFGNTTYQSSNLFGRKVAIDGLNAAISYEPLQTSYTIEFSGSYILESASYQSTGSDNLVLGRVDLYSLQADNSWNKVGEMRRNKEANNPFNVFGRGLALCSDFLVIGAPIYNVPDSSSYDDVIDKFNQISSSILNPYSGSVFVYDLDNLEYNPLIGNVFYKNGYLVVTSTASNYSDIFTKTGSYGFDMIYQGTHTIYENEYLISIRPGEFNYSTNPTSLIQNALLFDVNGDGVFDLNDVDLIMRYLNKKRFYEEYVFDDNGIILEQDNRLSAWWNNELLLTEAGDVLLQESDFAAYLVSSSFSAFTKAAYDYIETYLDNTGILDVNGDGQVDLNDGAILVAYFTNKLTPVALLQWIDENATRRYVTEIEQYIGKYTGVQRFYTDPTFFNYQESSSYDPTGSYLAPYITTIGLYDNGRLVGVGKLGKPVKNLIDWPINFIVRFDT